MDARDVVNSISQMQESTAAAAVPPSSVFGSPVSPSRRRPVPLSPCLARSPSPPVPTAIVDSSQQQQQTPAAGKGVLGTKQKLPQSVFGYAVYTMVVQNNHGSTSKLVRMLYALLLAFAALGAQWLCVQQVVAMNSNPLAEKYYDDSWETNKKNAFMDWACDPYDGALPEEANITWRSKACIDTWDFPGAKLKDMGGYVSHKYASAFVTVIMIIWMAHALKEVGEIYKFSIISLSSGLPCGLRALLGLIVLCRVVIMSFLAWEGAKWLCFSETFQDALLNGVALNFIYDLDELIYTACVVSSHKEACENCEVPRKDMFPDIGLIALETLAAVIATLIAVVFQTMYLSEFQDMYTFSYCAVCGDVYTEICKDGNAWAQMVALSRRLWPERFAST
eukprot:TRINITY_DN15352_c0_g1_i1.p1 TRINITY_DN15352_c0_g1~~TRINITY_DN15352_c0_g1_i1.p1  ORF type:complete len:393 (+),score=53.64 TRINITY_DN15352_c0_g1_i1:151-1329(+)